MQISRAAACYVSTFMGAFGVTSSAFSTRYISTRVTHQQPSAFLPGKLQIPRALLLINRQRPSLATGSRVSPALHMSWLQNFFGGGAYNTRMDYDTLEFPGPELAQLAQDNKISSHSPSKSNLELATFAGGCFWGLELAFQRVPGVAYTAAGYSQGPEAFPTYDQVCAGNMGHTEAVCVYFDPNECSYESLLDTFFQRVDPTTVNGQGRDYGRQYRTGVYYHTDEQEALARARFEAELSKYKRPIATECMAAKPFWPAEEYHQQYLAKGGRFGTPQSAEKGSTDEIQCYG
jgi:peptide-methionine (S)-S-oxide reductase